MHENVIRPSFYRVWADPKDTEGTENTKGRFSREIEKLKKSFRRKCSTKNLVPRPGTRSSADSDDSTADSDADSTTDSDADSTTDSTADSTADSDADSTTDSDADSTADFTVESIADALADFAAESLPRKKNNNSSEARERRSHGHGEVRVANNPAHQARHIIKNLEKWTELYLAGCRNRDKIVRRWGKFVLRWMQEIAKNPIFVEEFAKEETYLRSHGTRKGRRCGYIYNQFGLSGREMTLYDASEDDTNGFDDLGRTDFGNDELMSMVPYAGW